MPLEACPQCGYAVSMIDHQCRHCSGPSPAIPKFKKLDPTIMSSAIFIAVIVSVVIYWTFFAQ
jgi:hypothetical protein